MSNYATTATVYLVLHQVRYEESWWSPDLSVDAVFTSIEDAVGWVSENYPDLGKNEDMSFPFWQSDNVDDDGNHLEEVWIAVNTMSLNQRFLDSVYRYVFHQRCLEDVDGFISDHGVEDVDDKTKEAIANRFSRYLQNNSDWYGDLEEAAMEEGLEW